MTQLSKTAFALLLLAGGFIAARTFGPPDLAQRLVDPWRPAPQSQWSELQPAAANDHRAEVLAPLDAMEMPASMSAAQASVAQPPLPLPAAPPAELASPQWPSMPGLDAAPEPAAWPGTASQAPASTWPGQHGVQPSAYQTDMVNLRRPSSSVPATPAAQPYEVAKPLPPDPWAPAAPSGPPTKEVSVGLPAGDTSFAPWGAPPVSSYDSAALPAAVPVVPQVGTLPAWAGEATSETMTPLSVPDLPAMQHTAEEPRSHIVADGDSLARLAQRYLGDPKRSTEIYEKNRDLLTHPDLLPLGVELRLP